MDSSGSLGQFLHDKSKARSSRQDKQRAAVAALRIQRWYRGRKCFRAVQCLLCDEVRTFLSDYLLSPSTAKELYHNGQKLLFISKTNSHNMLFQMFCKAVNKSMESSSVKVWYVSLALNKTLVVQWLRQVKAVLLSVCKQLSTLKPGMPQDDATLAVYLNIFVTLTDYTLWKLTTKGGDALRPSLHQLCYNLVLYLVDNKLFLYLHELLLKGLGCQFPKLTKHTLPAAMGIRAIAICNFDVKISEQFVCHVLSTPACLLHLNSMVPETMAQLNRVNLLSHCIIVLTNSRPHLSSTLLLCLMGNLVQLGRHANEYLSNPKNRHQYLTVLSDLLAQCSPTHSSTHSTTSCWHLLFGWCDETIDSRLMNGLVHVMQQLHSLWHRSVVEIMFAPVLALTPHVDSEHKTRSLSSVFKKLLSLPTRTLDQSVINEVYQVATFYTQCVAVLPQLASDILVGLSCACSLLPAKLWYFLRCGCGTDVKAVTHAVVHNDRLTSVLTLFCQVTQYLLNVLDDQELHEERYFPLAKLSDISSLLNHVLYNVIWDQRMAARSSPVCVACHSLLALLHQRDSRRRFSEQNTWDIKAVNASKFLSEWTTRQKRAVELLQYIPHVVPHRKRVEVFYQHIADDRRSLGIDHRSARVPATYINIHRSRLLEDGYQQLSSLSPTAIKGTVRVKFINEQGLDEAGIDETGVFKEFLEETIRQAFNPDLNLFKTNSDGFLYPSQTSHIHDNHLQLLEFMGRMLAKAVYDGIVLEVPFASFFLSQLAKRNHSLHYSSLDELYSLDAELSKSLQYVKHCEDAEDICLTFSFDESFMGKTVTYELIPGGSGVPVTNDNRINYVHRMALYKMHTQIKQQCSAFLRGFHCIVPPSWLACFTPRELQRVISGDDVELDINDLRHHTVYYGGYHDKHRVVVWLWNMLKTEFTSQQKASFLKFVTSCSRPPLLGFSQLDPPFSIRLVDTKDEEDQVTVGGAVRGLLGLNTGAKARLPTASTCFNLLKLPNYQKRVVLKEKLLYAVTSNAGFELS